MAEAEDLVKEDVVDITKTSKIVSIIVFLIF